MHIGLKIKELAESKKVSAKELGDKIGRTRQAVYDIYSGKVSVNIDLLEKIAKALDINIVLFLKEHSQWQALRKEMLNDALNEIIPIIISKNYISILEIRQLIMDIHVNATKGKGLVNLNLVKQQNNSSFILEQSYEELKNSLKEKDLKRFTQNIFNKYFTDLKQVVDSSDYKKIIAEYFNKKPISKNA
ncbi:MAG: helix-turn-helix domain-containing protein [Bacteroidales bacterium]|jgi:transcriptional regulator with XRE-family HTH domain